MQSGFPKETKGEHEEHRVLIEKAKNGDNAALEELMNVLEPDIKTLAQYIKMPKEDSMQEIKAQFIAALRQGNEE